MYKRRGYEWEHSFRLSIIRCLPGAFIYKIIDTHSIEGLLSKLKESHQQYNKFLVPKVPADFIIIHYGRTMWIECKNTTNLTSFPLSNIAKHQLEFGVQIASAGGEYFFAIQRDEPYKKRAFLIDINTFLEIKSKVNREGKKSIKWLIFENHPNVKELELMRGSIYDLRKELE